MDITIRPPEWTRQPRILVIDDELANVRTFRRMLERSDIGSVVSTTDPREAVPLFRSTAPDLVLLDLHMPELDGFAVLEALAPLISPSDYVPILVLTGDGQVTAKHRALSMGARDYLTKPFELGEARLRIRNLLQTRLLHLALQQRNDALTTLLARRTWELEEARLEMLERLARAAELRDDTTGEHMQRVGRLAAALATAIGMSRDMVEAIRRAAPLHDIGKLGIPDAILLKCGRLGEDEIDIMRAHATIGARILANGHSAVMRLAEEIAHCHHERWDGSGYPRGLAGSDIPLSARIVAVADVADALAFARPYRRALTRHEVATELVGGACTQFDPGVVAALAEIDWPAILDGASDGRPEPVAEGGAVA